MKPPSPSAASSRRCRAQHQLSCCIGEWKHQRLQRRGKVPASAESLTFIHSFIRSINQQRRVNLWFLRLSLQTVLESFFLLMLVLIKMKWVKGSRTGIITQPSAWLQLHAYKCRLKWPMVERKKHRWVSSLSVFTGYLSRCHSSIFTFLPLASLFL